MMKDEPYYAQLPWVRGGEAASGFTWQFIPLDPRAFDELTFAKEFVGQLSKAGQKVGRAGRSVMEGLFNKNYNAAAVMMDKGVVDAVFFANSAEVSKIKVSALGRYQNRGHYKYVI